MVYIHFGYRWPAQGHGDLCSCLVPLSSEQPVHLAYWWNHWKCSRCFAFWKEKKRCVKGVTCSSYSRWHGMDVVSASWGLQVCSLLLSWAYFGSCSMSNFFLIQLMNSFCRLYQRSEVIAKTVPPPPFFWIVTNYAGLDEVNLSFWFRHIHFTWEFLCVRCMFNFGHFLAFFVL